MFVKIKTKIHPDVVSAYNGVIRSELIESVCSIPYIILFEYYLCKNSTK